MRIATAATVEETVTLRRALVVVGEPSATPQDQIDCAELLLATGFPDAARILNELAFIRVGFTEQRREEQRARALRTGLWQPVSEPPAATGEKQAAFAIDQAVGDLKRLLAVPLDPSRSMLPSAGERDREEESQVVPGSEPVAPRLDGRAFAELSTRLYDALRGDRSDALDAVLDEIRALVLHRPAYILAEHFNASAIDLAGMVAFNGLRRFFLTNYPLCWAPFGSAQLLWESARIEEASLGPYFTNISCLIRTSRDILGFLDLAGLDNRRMHKQSLERWCVLLSAHLDRDNRVGLADELGDLGLTRALRGIYETAQRNPGRDHYLYWAIRDAALDNGDAALAVDVQTTITELSHRNSGELVVLAEILATLDASAAAEEALQKALAMAPHDRGAAARLAALREDRFLAYRADRGFGSSHHRSALRMRNRADRDALEEAAADDRRGDDEGA